MICNKYFIYSISWLLLNLSISVSSIIWLSEIVQDTTPATLIRSGGLLAGSLLLPIIPGALAAYYRKKAEFASTDAYMKKFVQSYKNSPELFLDKSFRATHEPWLLKDARGILKNMQEIIYGTTLGVASFILDAVIMACIVDVWFAAAYVTSASAFASTLCCTTGKIKTLSTDSMNKEIELTNTLKSGWDNIVIGNKINFNVWYKKYQSIFAATQKLSVSYSTWTKFIGSFSTIIAIIPILITTGVLFYFYKEAKNLDQIALLFAIIPRQLQTIQYFKDLSSTLTEMSGAIARKNILVDTLEDPFKNKLQVAYKLKWDKLSFSLSQANTNQDITLTSPEDFLSRIEALGTGRLTIRGENKSGKSILLYMLHDYLLNKKLNSFFLPVGVDLAFNSSAIDKTSTGGKLLVALEEIDNKFTNEKFILLDEWDANLDTPNMEKMSNLIHKFSQTKCVIEARHRSESKNEQPILVESEFEEYKGIKKEVFFNYDLKNSILKNDDNLTVHLQPSPPDEPQFSYRELKNSAT